LIEYGLVEMPLRA